MTASLRVYVDRLRSLANTLITTRRLSLPELIELNACLMLVAIAQKLGDCEPDLFDEAWLGEVKTAIAQMRDDVRETREEGRLRWN